MMARKWSPKKGGDTAPGNPASGNRARNGESPPSAFDSQVAKQWAEGRLPMDGLLALVRELRDSLEQDTEKKRRGDSSESPHEKEAHQLQLILQRFAFDTHLREECRVLVSLLRSCDRDLIQCQGLDMTLKLIELAEIQAAIRAVDKD